MEEVNINSEEIDQITDGQKIKSVENYSVPEESTEALICDCLRFLGRSGRTYRYGGVTMGCVKAIFSKDGRVTSTQVVRTVQGRNYNFTPLPGQELGFQCC